MRGLNGLAVILVLAAVLAGCTDDAALLTPGAPLASSSEVTSSNMPEYTGRYLILGRGGNLPRDLEARIAAAGGELIRVIPEVGLAVARPAAADFTEEARRIPGVEAIAPDMMLQWTDPQVGRATGTLTVEPPVATSQSIGEDAFFGALQWAPAAIDAPKAWAAGYTGAGVRVAILDGAIWDQHLDLAPNLDASVSRSFTPGSDWNQDVGTFWHGTHVAGIVAATGDVGIVGIAPKATLIGVKVLHDGSGAFEWIIDGIVYAATPVERGGAGAHVINMSLGASIDRTGWSKSKAFRDDIRILTMALDRASRYAYQQGTTVIASAGNGGTNHDVASELLKLPAQTQHVISVSATGPHGWALGNSDFDRPAYYSDYGKSLVDVAAPGGTIGLFVVDGVDSICSVSGAFGNMVQFCETFDLVMSTVRGSGASVTAYNWAQGTSMAAPAAAGVAALIIEANGGSMNPHGVRAALRRSATDLGSPGNDEFYGHGWVNAWRAVR